MPVTSTVSVEEIVLFLVAGFGVIHHTRLLWRLRGYCADAENPADVILCRLCRRKEWARLGLKILLVYGACLMMTQPLPVSDDWPDLAVLLIWRLGLIAAAAWLDVESVLAERDRVALGRLPTLRRSGQP